MAREFPRFIYSNPKNTKSKGPFIIHMLPPHVVCRAQLLKPGERGADAQFDKIGLTHLSVLDRDPKGYEVHQLQDVRDDMASWLFAQIANKQINPAEW